MAGGGWPSLVGLAFVGGLLAVAAPSAAESGPDVPPPSEIVAPWEVHPDVLALVQTCSGPVVGEWATCVVFTWVEIAKTEACSGWTGLC